MCAGNISMNAEREGNLRASAVNAKQRRELLDIIDEQRKEIEALKNELHDVLDSKDASLDAQSCSACGGVVAHTTYCVVSRE